MVHRSCSIEGCDTKHYGKGYCKRHYLRQWKHGNPSTVISPRDEAQKFYDDVVVPYEGNECLIWPHARIRGYGRMMRDGRFVVVSRVLCEETNGPPPTPEHQAAHSCGRGEDGCVTKAHLSWKTRVENEADKATHGTRLRGESVNHARLTEAQVHEIAALAGKASKYAIAKRFGVSWNAVHNIHTGRTWGWLTNTQQEMTRLLKAGL